MIPNWMQSSVSPEKVSATITGAVTASASVIVLILATVFHITVNVNDVIALGTSLGILGGTIWAIKGLIIKMCVKLTPTVLPVV